MGEISDINADTAPRQTRIGERLVQMGLITRDQLDVVVHEQQRSDKMLGTILVEFGFLTEDELSTVLAERTGFDLFHANVTPIDPAAVQILPKSLAEKHNLLLLTHDAKARQATVAMIDPYDVLAMDQIRRYLPHGTEIILHVATSVELSETIDRYYGYELSIDGILAEISGRDIGEKAALELARSSAQEGYVHPLVRLVNAIIFDAVKLGASDLHFEPEEQFLRLRYRIDGVMHHIRAFHRDYWPGISHRLKILSGMNIAEKFRPQDGRFSMNLGNREVDFRVSAMPTAHGENIVLRVLDKTRALRHMEELGFSPYNLGLLQRALQRPEGMIIVTGPTGSGKTTTLYAMLEQLSGPDVNIMTLEDPIEYQIPGIRQTQVREQSGLGFGVGARAVLRQDPDIIFIGEVRDTETAQMALRAAMTGHQVFTTLHTNDAIGAISRLFDLGLNPGLMAGNVIAVLAQRLVRTLCVQCKKPAPASAEELKLLGEKPGTKLTLHQPVGCEQCFQTGYRGRVAIGEVLLVDEALDDVIARNGTRGDLMQTALNFSGFQGMIEDGVDKVKSGLITLDSLKRAVDMTKRMD